MKRIKTPEKINRNRRDHDRAWRQLRHLDFCRLHLINGNRLVSGSREQARHKPTVGFGGFYNENLVHC